MFKEHYTDGCRYAAHSKLSASALSLWQPVQHSNSGGLSAGLAAATEQLPVVGDSKAQSEAQMLLDACQAAQADTWALPLALILEDVNCLAGIKRRHPQLWLEVKMELHKDEQLCIYLDVMASADEVRLTGTNASS